MNNSPKTCITFTRDTFKTKYLNNHCKVDYGYLLDSLIMQLDNTKYLCDLLSDNRIKVRNIAFLTLKDLINLDLKINFGNYYECSNYQVKKLINQYELNNTLNDLIDYINDVIEENHLRERYEIELFFENENQEIITSTSYDNQSIFFNSLTAAKKEYSKLKTYYKKQNKHSLKRDIEYNVISLNDVYNNDFTVVKSEKLI